MLNHYTMIREDKEALFSIVDQVEIPFGYPCAGLYRYLQLNHVGAHCPDCGTWTVSVHESIPKQVIAGSHNDTPIIDYFIHRRLRCEVCPRTFMEPLAWLQPYQRITTIGQEAMTRAAADRTFKAVGRAFNRSGQNVGVHVRDYLMERPELSERPTPAFIGMDEISLAKGKSQYRLVIYDLSVPWRPQLFVMHESRRKEEVINILQQLQQPDRVMAVAIDMWRGYKTAIETALPQAMVVIDAFHVIQASTKALGDVRKEVQQSLTKDQRAALKQDKDLFAEPIEDLNEDQRERVKEWEELSPTMATAIRLHQKLRALYRCHDLEEALALLAAWEKEILDSALEPFQDLLQTIWNWLPEILNRFICRISNAKTEGKNNQMRTMNLQGFGYSIPSIQARMLLKEELEAIIRWREYQKCCERKLEESSTAAA